MNMKSAGIEIYQLKVGSHSVEESFQQRESAGNLTRLITALLYLSH